jgi:hypothetical protein
MKASTSFIAMAVLAVAASAQLTRECSVEILPSMTFDLTPLRRGTDQGNGIYVASASQMYSVNDTSGAGLGRDYLYEFNFCGAVTPTGACASKATGPLPAFQSDTDDQGFCYPLANQTKHGWQFSSYGKPSMLADLHAHHRGGADTRYPWRGVTLTYTGGSSSGCNGISRQLNLKLACSGDSNSKDVGDNELVVERQSCIYDLYLESLYGCPTRE